MGFSNFHYCHNFYNNSVTFSTIPTINTTKNYCILNFERMPTMETEENQQQQLDKPPKKKARIEESKENAMPKPKDANLLVTGNEALESSSKLLNVRSPLPLELSCEIYKCLKVPIQTKFIWGLGRGIYGAFRHKLLVKTKRLRNPRENGWIKMKRTESISPDELTINDAWKYFFAKLAFNISGDCRKKYNDFPGTILYYFEVSQMSSASSNWIFYICLTNKESSRQMDSYTFSIAFDYCKITGKEHAFEWPNGTIKPTWNGRGDVVGCGLLLSPENELSIFFTGNGILMGKQIQINPLADCLYPMVKMNDYADMTLETNFGDDPAKPFKYDTEKCLGLGLD